MGNGSAEYPVVVRDIGDDGFELGAVIGSKWVPFGRKNRGYLDTLADTEEPAAPETFEQTEAEAFYSGNVLEQDDQTGEVQS